MIFCEITNAVGLKYLWDGEMPAVPRVGEHLWLGLEIEACERCWEVEDVAWRMNHNDVWWACLRVRELPERGLQPKLSR